MKNLTYLILILLFCELSSCTKTDSEKGIKNWEGNWKIDLYLLDENAKPKFFTKNTYKEAQLSIENYGTLNIDEDLNGNLDLNGVKSTFLFYCHTNDYFFNLKNWRTLDGAKIWFLQTDFYFLVKDKKGKERFLEVSDIFEDVFPLVDGASKMYLKLTKI